MLSGIITWKDQMGVRFLPWIKAIQIIFLLTHNNNINLTKTFFLFFHMKDFNAQLNTELQVHKRI